MVRCQCMLLCVYLPTYYLQHMMCNNQLVCVYHNVCCCFMLHFYILVFPSIKLPLLFTFLFLVHMHFTLAVISWCMHSQCAPLLTISHNMMCAFQGLQLLLLDVLLLTFHVLCGSVVYLLVFFFQLTCWCGLPIRCLLNIKGIGTVGGKCSSLGSGLVKRILLVL